MKRTIILTLFCITGISVAFAQVDCKMCGTWTGIFKAFTERYNDVADNKIVVRVRKNDDSYSVRVKEIDVRSGDVFYWRACTVTSYTEGSISFYIEEPMRWDEQDNGYYTYTSYYTLTYSKGTLIYNQDSYTIIDYDKNKRRIGAMYEPGKDCYHHIPLYKDDDDW